MKPAEILRARVSRVRGNFLPQRQNATLPGMTPDGKAGRIALYEPVRRSS